MPNLQQLEHGPKNQDAIRELAQEQLPKKPDALQQALAQQESAATSGFLDSGNQNEQRIADVQSEVLQSCGGFIGDIGKTCWDFGAQWLEQQDWQKTSYRPPKSDPKEWQRSKPVETATPSPDIGGPLGGIVQEYATPPISEETEAQRQTADIDRKGTGRGTSNERFRGADRSQRFERMHGRQDN